MHYSIMTTVNDSTASRMRSLYALHLSLSVAISTIQPRLRLSGTNHLRSAFHGGQRLTRFFCIFSDSKENCLPTSITIHTSSKRLAMGFFYR
ncbi:MAG: hypothetical protein KZQ59_14125 [Candidatus Thiodiazotropha sp. (ex Lucinoma aequizonata)]|nr:hypothetical protein [Candidatus Thiodiazotropha sp. (ex Lucinoma aequizonata)]MCU7908888.1 hypothetical protein [Candidatus Thiodiazotropha sp. (ex Lucinoma aequizonata)]